MAGRGFPYGVVAFGGLLLAWWLAARLEWINPFLLPSPAVVLATGYELAESGQLWKHTLVSLKRVGLGYLLAITVALTLALGFILSRPLRSLAEPPLEFLRQIPPLALLPLLMLWLGIGETQKVGVILLGCFFPIFLGLRGGIAQVDPKLVEVGRTCGFSRGEILWRIVLPASLPAVIVGLRIGLGYSWRALVGAELIASSAGLGYLIVDAENLARTDIVLVGVLTIGIIGLAADSLLRLLITRAAPWLAKDLEMARA